MGKAASVVGNTDIIHELLSAGAVADSDAFVAAGKAGHVDMATALLAAKAEIGGTDALGWQAIHAAAWNGNTQLVKGLLKHNASVDVANGGTFAVKWGNDIAFPNKKISDGRAPIHLAAESGHVSVLDLLHSSGARLDAKTDMNQSALDLSKAAGQIRTSEWLETHLSKVSAQQEGITHAGEPLE